MKNVTAKDLLQLTTVYLGNWQNISNADKHPASYRRLQQIEAMISAFFEKELKNPNQELQFHRYFRNGINYFRKDLSDRMSKLDYFLDGEFLNDRKNEENSRELVEKILKERQFWLEMASGESRKEISKIRFSRLFSYLFFEYRFFYPVAHWRGVEVAESADYDYFYSRKFRARIRDEIKTTFADLEDDLCLLIDPKSRSFSREALVENYGLPDVDLGKLDEEYNSF